MPKIEIFKVVLQKHGFDCAICCVAMFCGISYQDLMKEVPYLTQANGSVMSRHIGMSKLEQLLIIEMITGRMPITMDAHHQPERNKKRIMQLLKGKKAILSCLSQNYEGVHHCVYWDGKDVHDPSTKKRFDNETIIPYEVIF